MIRKLLSLLVSLMLVAAFYVYAVLMEDESAKGDAQWVVEETAAPVLPMDAVVASDARTLAAAFGAAAPLPGGSLTGRVESGSYHGYTVRLLNAAGETLSVRGVRPASAAPLVVTRGLRYLAAASALLGFPVMTASKDGTFYYYFAAADAVFEIAVPAQSGQEAAARLDTLTLTEPH